MITFASTKKPIQARNISTICFLTIKRSERKKNGLEKSFVAEKCAMNIR
jgi:hypothetical protein